MYLRLYLQEDGVGGGIHQGEGEAGRHRRGAAPGPTLTYPHPQDEGGAPGQYLDIYLQYLQYPLQFTCAVPTLGLNSHNLKDVWVCNSDGYVGQVDSVEVRMSEL